MLQPSKRSRITEVEIRLLALLRVWDPLFRELCLIGSIFVEVLVAPEVGATAVSSPAGVLELDTHSSSEADPSKNDLESDTEISKRHVSPTPHDAMLTRWRSRVASRSSSPTTSIPEIPTAPILP
ncbi:hypothetical protein Tco_1106101 [Tanacetum coccineum]